jgi:hypothetical protein
MGNIGSYADLTSGRRRHQAKTLDTFAAFRSREILVPPCRSAAFRIEAGSSR